VRYRTRQITVEAVRFDGDNRAEVEAFIRQSVDAPVEWERNPPRPIVPTPRGNMMCHVGEWIVRVPDAGVFTVNPKLIEFFFAEAP
jgi:hypothetical protein